jgi:hypothetical protein
MTAYANYHGHESPLGVETTTPAWICHASVESGPR